MIRYNATDKTEYKGSVFINPGKSREKRGKRREMNADGEIGGPGGSGVWFMTKLAKHYQSVVGKNYVRYYDFAPISLFSANETFKRILSVLILVAVHFVPCLHENLNTNRQTQSVSQPPA